MKATMQVLVGEGRAICTATAEVAHEDGLAWVDLESVLFNGVDIFSTLSADQIEDIEQFFSDADMSEVA